MLHALRLTPLEGGEQFFSRPFPPSRHRDVGVTGSLHISSALVTSTILYLRDLHLSQWKEFLSIILIHAHLMIIYFTAVLLLDTEFTKVLGALLGN